MGLKSLLPWWAKIAGKLLLARLPIPYEVWQKLGLFRHGETTLPEKAVRTFRHYHDHARRLSTLPAEFTCLELGPGDSVSTGLVARALGARQVWLSDTGHYAAANTGELLELVKYLAAKGLVLPKIDEAGSFEDLMKAAGVTYLTNGIDSLRDIPDASIDLIWSQVVLEHVRYADFPRLLRELRRIAAPQGIGVHSIDFRDHLGGGLNNLRFTDRIWESSMFQTSGFYTNRIRPSEMIQLIESAGFSVQIIMETRWKQAPINRRQVSERFASISDDDMMISELELAIRPS